VQAGAQDSTIGKEKAGNRALSTDIDAFVADLDDIPACYTHMGPIKRKVRPPWI
jgi:hypothetical protein